MDVGTTPHPDDIHLGEKERRRRRALNPKKNQAEKDAEKMVRKANKDIVSSKVNEVDKNDGSSSSSKPSSKITSKKLAPPLKPTDANVSAPADSHGHSKKDEEVL